jgi:hypothetical protein
LDHLGKVITYLTSFDAGAAVWVVGDARPEHLQAVSWLNEASSVDFYMFKVEAIRIGDSEPAPLLTLLVGPSDEVKAIGRRKGEMAEREVERRAFWVGFLELARAETPEFARISNPPTGTFLSTSSVPYQGVSLGYNVRQHDTGGYIYVLLGAEREVETWAVFEALHARGRHPQKSGSHVRAATLSTPNSLDHPQTGDKDPMTAGQQPSGAHDWRWDRNRRAAMGPAGWCGRVARWPKGYTRGSEATRTFLGWLRGLAGRAMTA